VAPVKFPRARQFVEAGAAHDFVDHGWQEVAQTALDFVERFVPAKRS
jgi:hypothetical protein